jgi:hypothetical protein
MKWKRNVARWIRAVLMAPLLAMYASDGCTTASAMRDVASGLDDAADEIDGGQGDKDVGDVISDWVDDW